MMTVLSEHSNLIALSVMLVFIFVCLRGLKGQKTDVMEIKYWLSRDKWQGEVTTATLREWKQTSTMHNFNHFFIVTFDANLEGRVKQYKAAAALKVSEIPHLKKGMPIMIKYQGVPPKKIAVLSMQAEH
ncbi:hypothetical protein [Kluyvera intermedia]|nr:hypothetical protein [Kluyvera intermedia]